MRRYHVTTFGCQMNAHDSERIKGLLESVGLGETQEPEEADVVVFNTCTIREKADERFVAHLMNARAAKERDPEKVIVVGGCWSESVKDELFDLYPFVDLAFGPGNIKRLADFIGANGEVPRGHFSTFDEFAGDLPMHRERPYQAWLQISHGLQLDLLVLHRAGRARPRALARGGRHRGRGRAPRRRRRPRADAARARTSTPGAATCRSPSGSGFGGLLRLLDAIDGIERIRYTSPHPKDMRDDVIAAHASAPSVCEHVHLPLQSGSTPHPASGCAAPTRASATWRSSSGCAARCRTSR